MDAGWCWQIEHEHRINRGYVYSSDFIRDEDAEREFRAKNPKVGTTRIVRFVAGRYERTWVKNVVAHRQRRRASSSRSRPPAWGAICTQAAGAGGNADRQATCNAESRTWSSTTTCASAAHWDTDRELPGDALQVQHAARHAVLAGLPDRHRPGWAEEIVDYYRAVGPSVVARDTLLDYNDQFGMEGYLTMLVGQDVPYQKPYQPSDQERASWSRIQQAVKNKVAGATRCARPWISSAPNTGSGLR